MQYKIWKKEKQEGEVEKRGKWNEEEECKQNDRRDHKNE